MGLGRAAPGRALRRPGTRLSRPRWQRPCGPWRYGFDDYVGDVLAVLTALGGPPPLVIGHSMGGYIAARLAARHSARIAGVVITDILTAWPDDFAQFARRQAERPAMAFASVAAAGERFKL
ncbi:MAG TPA: alpha/beta fold hydrolase, partial [Candidatus Limnocylindria bacterium]|nr:alpha/beta fold hydrolase [Candidatus Limnocylindria bacterium]